NVHRADLIDLLAAQLPAGVLRLGVRCEGFSQDAEGVSLRLATGEVLRGDALIGADGIHSPIRRQLHGEDDIQFANILMWRALIPAQRLQGIDLPECGNYWVGPGRTLITYWVRSRQLYSVLASVPVDEVHRESWTESGDIDDLRRSFSGLEPRAQRMMEQIDSAFVTGMYYRDPIERWSCGRVTLMGDAAHPMVPFLAQGACQGMEDAWTLASVLAEVDGAGVAEALAEYERRRRPRTTRVQSGARAMVKLVHEADPQRMRARDGRWKGMQRIDPMTAATWGFVWDYDVIDAVRRPAGDVLGLSATREAKALRRPEAQRAFALWKGLFSPEDVARGHDGMRAAYERFLLERFPAPADLRVDSLEPGGVPALQVRAPGVADGPLRILHFHGGGYMVGSARGSLEYAGRLSRSLGAACVSVDYRLAPEHPYPAALDDALDAYRGLLRSGVPAGRILLSGESAGGGLALALALLLRGAGEALPAGIFAVCPFTDLALGGPSIAQFSGDDPAANRDSLAYMAASYFQGHEPTDPLVSPLYGELAGLPPLFLSAVQGETLLSDTLRLEARARTAGVPTTLRLVEDSVHVYPLFPFLPETAETLAHLAEWAAGIGWRA
ncbi:alpha/beta hydrolase fold domain-containing protein, partial [Pseudomonas citronellolis]|uniref:alpha/beta hydrolase fold domain-containing protein n=1 Tax=Pseudomonas citronellolis TaxID=53408 RepID=UPI0023E3A340